MHFHFDQNDWIKGSTANLPYKASSLHQKIQEHIDESKNKGFLGLTVKKKGLIVWQLNKKTGSLTPAEIMQSCNGRMRIVKQKDCDYFQALNEETAKAKARRLFLNKY